MAQAAAYSEPDWGRSPEDKYALQVLKGGSIVETIDLGDKSFYVAGRQPDVCDIGMEHPSVSRQHAVIQLSAEGLSIYDLQSAQGTFVNKKKVPPLSYERLRVGDMVRFAASSRLYVVCGPAELMPPEYDSANVRKVREKVVALSAQAAVSQSQGASWGFGEDAVDDEADEAEGKAALPDYVKKDENYERKYGSKYESRLSESDVGGKDKKTVEKVRKRELKIQNMQEETRRIYVKEGSQESGLTEGQLAAVQRNDARIAVLVGEIEELETELQQRSASRGTGAAKGVERRADSDEELLDTTRETADMASNWRMRRRAAAGAGAASAAPSKALSLDELSALVAAESARLSELRATLSAVVAADEGPSEESAAAEDGVDALVAEAMREERRGTATKLTEDIEAASAKLASYNRLIRVATPALGSLARSAASAMPVESSLKSQEAVATSEALPSSSSKAAKRKDAQTFSLAACLDLARKSAEASGDEPGSDEPGSDELGAAAPAQPRVSSKQTKRARLIGPASGPPALPGASGQLEGGDAVWVPPQNQSGDGRTALNDKLGY